MRFRIAFERENAALQFARAIRASVNDTRRPVVFSLRDIGGKAIAGPSTPLHRPPALIGRSRCVLSCTLTISPCRKGRIERSIQPPTHLVAYTASGSVLVPFRL